MRQGYLCSKRGAVWWRVARTSQFKSQNIPRTCLALDYTLFGFSITWAGAGLDPLPTPTAIDSISEIEPEKRNKRSTRRFESLVLPQPPRSDRSPPLLTPFLPFFTIPITKTRARSYGASRGFRKAIQNPIFRIHVARIHRIWKIPSLTRRGLQ